MSEKFQTPYRPDIDGLRAVAVSLVVLYHAFPKQLAGGYVGVDVFFVISGYLITQIIARELQEGHFSIARFYERRVRRIFPALLVVLIAVIMVGWQLLLPLEFEQLGLDVLAGAAFFSNVASLAHSGYFDVASSSRPLLHLWSLGIEEQFYLAWPLVLALTYRLRQPVGLVVALLALLSFIANVWFIGSHPIASFYLPFTRAWELLAGALLAFASANSLSPATANARSFAGILLIVAAVWLLNPKSSFPGWWALLPVLGAALIISAPSAIPNRVLLASRPFVGVGLISYPLYLWHWPTLVFGDALNIDNTNTKRAILVGLSAAFAWLTYRYVERIFRRGTLNHLKIAGLGAAMAAAGLTGCFLFLAEGAEWRFPREVRDVLSKAALVEPWRASKCLLADQQRLAVDECVDRNSRPLVMVWGDSTAGALMPGLRKLQETRPFGLAQFTISSCEPLLTEIANRGRPNCKNLNEQVLEQVGKLHPQIVLLHAIWYPTADHLDALLNTISQIQSLGVERVIVLGRVPVWYGGLPMQIFKFYSINRYLPERIQQPPRDNWYDVVMRAKIDPTGAIFISVWDALCQARDCLARVPNGAGGEDIIAVDQIHFTESGSRFLIRSIEPLLFTP